MRRTICASMSATGGFALGSEARAAEGLHTGDTVRTGGNLFYGEVGPPDLSLGMHTVSPTASTWDSASRCHTASSTAATRRSAWASACPCHRNASERPRQTSGPHRARPQVADSF